MKYAPGASNDFALSRLPKPQRSCVVSRRDNASSRCARCHVHCSLCFCDSIPRLFTRTRLLLVIHHREAKKPTNTGTLAAECLANSEVWVRGRPGDSDLGRKLDPATQPLLLFPHERARPLDTCVEPSRPCTLIVPDGTWRQAVKVGTRVPCLAGVPWVTLPPGPPTAYRLRQESHPSGLATMEAIARAFGILESPEVQVELENVFRRFTERTLWSRGSVNAEDVKDGLPEGNLRHVVATASQPTPDPDTATGAAAAVVLPVAGAAPPLRRDPRR